MWYYHRISLRNKKQGQNGGVGNGVGQREIRKHLERGGVTKRPSQKKVR